MKKKLKKRGGQWNRTLIQFLLIPSLAISSMLVVHGEGKNAGSTDLSLLGDGPKAHGNLFFYDFPPAKENIPGKFTMGEVITNHFQQPVDVEISGTILDENGKPIPGATVSIPGTGIGTATDLEGRYTLTVPEGATLVVSFIGFVSQKIEVGNQRIINVTLKEDVSALEEVVVIGYGEQRKTEITGAVANVNSGDFIQGNVGDAAQLIQGKVAGLTIVAPSGNPTDNSQILLRGTSTLATSTQPLILIDGIPGDLNTLAQDDIESIDVLKDGSAAAIYGTRGTNGVILITSKKNRGQIQPSF